MFQLHLPLNETAMQTLNINCKVGTRVGLRIVHFRTMSLFHTQLCLSLLALPCHCLVHIASASVLLHPHHQQIAALPQIECSRTAQIVSRLAIRIALCSSSSVLSSVQDIMAGLESRRCIYVVSVRFLYLLSP